MKPPLFTQRMMLPLTGVLLRCLDKDRQPIANAFASGFIRREAGCLYLYTCWHVVTGFDPNDIRVGFLLPQRQYLEVALQRADQRQPGVVAIGGLQTVVLPLYDSPQQPFRPLWLQDDRHIPHPDLNPIGLFVPFWHDLVKLKLPAEVEVPDMQVIDEERLNTMLVSPGDKCLVVGYPYGFSAFGPTQPTAIVLTRFAASDRIADRQQQFLLESIGAPGMSGGPVFVERADEIALLGIYTGSIYPDYSLSKNERTTALGTVSNLTLVLGGNLPLVTNPSQAHEARDS